MPIPPEFRIKEYDEAIEMLDDMKKKVEDGEIVSVLILAERSDGSMMGSTTRTENVFTVAGYMLFWAMKRMGFQDDHILERKK